VYRAYLKARFRVPTLTHIVTCPRPAAAVVRSHFLLPKSPTTHTARRTARNSFGPCPTPKKNWACVDSTSRTVHLLGTGDNTERRSRRDPGAKQLRGSSKRKSAWSTALACMAFPRACRGVRVPPPRRHSLRRVLTGVPREETAGALRGPSSHGVLPGDGKIRSCKPGERAAGEKGERGGPSWVAGKQGKQQVPEPWRGGWGPYRSEVEKAQVVVSLGPHCYPHLSDVYTCSMM
jgi:hypothetical protein